MAHDSLRGFALGMLIATSIFTAVYYFQPIKSEKIIEVAITDEKVQQYLNEKGYISVPKETYEKLKATSGNIEERGTAGSENTDIKESEEEIKIYILDVKAGMNSTEVANRLEKAGIINSSKEFEQFLVEKKWTRSIQIGSYELNNNMSFEQIGKMIINK